MNFLPPLSFIYSKIPIQNLDERLFSIHWIMYYYTVEYSNIYTFA